MPRPYRKPKPVAPADKKRGRLIRLSPQPVALSPSPLPPQPESKGKIESLTPFRAIVRTIRNKETNRELSHADRQELLAIGRLGLDAELRQSRVAFAAKYSTRVIPSNPFPYSCQSCPVSDDSQPTPWDTGQGKVNPPSIPPANPEFVRQCGKELNNLIDIATPSWKWKEYRDTRDKQLVAFQSRRNSHLATIIPPQPATRIEFGGSSIREEFRAHKPNLSVPFKNYLRRRDTIQTYRKQVEILQHQIAWEKANNAATRYTLSGVALAIAQSKRQDDYSSPARVTVRPAFKAGWVEIEETTGKRTIHAGVQSSQCYFHSGEPFSGGDRVAQLKPKTGKGNPVAYTSRALYERGVTPAMDEEISNAGMDAKLDVAAHVQQATARVKASELTDNWLVATRNPRTGLHTLESASTQKGAEYLASKTRLQHPDTLSSVLSRSEVLAHKWADLFADVSIPE